MITTYRHTHFDFTQLEALPEIVEAVGDRIAVFLDGGVRSGTDVFKALALGAKMVFVGRPICWGLYQNVMILSFSTNHTLSGQFISGRGRCESRY